MTDITTDVGAAWQPPKPNPDLKSLDVLVGRWIVSGGAQGEVTYRWTEGGFFLRQDIDLVQNGYPIKGIEMIGHEQGFGAEPSDDIRSRFYDFMGGMTLDYVYEVLSGDNGRTMLMIWGGMKGSPAYYKGELSDDGATCTGEWVYPGGGGYASTMHRVEATIQSTRAFTTGASDG